MIKLEAGEEEKLIFLEYTEQKRNSSRWIVSHGVPGAGMHFANHRIALTFMNVFTFMILEVS
jgi:hypothetical protein